MPGEAVKALPGLRATARALIPVMIAFLFQWSWGEEPPGDSSPTPLRFAFSSSMFSDVNENDARASVKAWAMSLAREKSVRISTEAMVLSGTAELQQALDKQSIDGAAVTAEEYFSLKPGLLGTHLFVSCIGGKLTEEYLLIVRNDSGIRSLADLHGKKVTLFENPRASLAAKWIEIRLWEQGLGSPAGFFGQFKSASKLSKVVVPVFFRQQDACVVTERGFQIVCELNPQLQAQLKVLQKSPPVVPAIGFFTDSTDPKLRESLFVALTSLEKTTAGGQMLTLFQTDQLLKIAPSTLDDTRRFLETHRNLRLRQSSKGIQSDFARRDTEKPDRP